MLMKFISQADFNNSLNKDGSLKDCSYPNKPASPY